MKIAGFMLAIISIMVTYKVFYDLHVAINNWENSLFH